MTWSYEEDEIVCRFYLKHPDNWKQCFNQVMDELHSYGYINRDEKSTKMRISNYSYLHTGKGLSKASKQSRAVYSSMR